MVSLFVKILEENELFFDEENIQLEQFFVKSGSDHFTSIRTLVNVAKVFFYTKKSNLEELRKLNSVVEVAHLQNTYICGEPIIKIHLRDNPIQKSVIMIALENRSYEMVELFRNGLTSENLNASKPLVFKPFSIQTRRFWIEQRLRETAIIIMIRTMRLSFHVNFNFFLLQVFEKISHSYFSANISGHYENSFEI